MLMSLDAKKAFDKIAWPFLYANLSLNLDRILLTIFRPPLTVNDYNTTPIDLFRGTPCPHFFLVFQ